MLLLLFFLSCFFPFLASSRNVKQTDWLHCFPVFPLIFMSVFYRTPLDLGSPRYKPASADNAPDGNPARLSNKQDAEPRGENAGPRLAVECHRKSSRSGPLWNEGLRFPYVTLFCLLWVVYEFPNLSQHPSFPATACFSYATRLTSFPPTAVLQFTARLSL